MLKGITGPLLVFSAFGVAIYILYNNKFPPFNTGGIFEQLANLFTPKTPVVSPQLPLPEQSAVMPAPNFQQGGIAGDRSGMNPYTMTPYGDKMIDLGSGNFMPNPSPLGDISGRSQMPFGSTVASDPSGTDYGIYTQYLNGLRQEQARNEAQLQAINAQNIGIGGDITTLPQPPTVGGPYPTPGMMRPPIIPPMMPPMMRPPPPRFIPYPVPRPQPYLPPPQYEPEEPQCRIRLGSLCIGYDGSIKMGDNFSIGGKGNRNISIGGGNDNSPRVRGGAIDFSGGGGGGGLFGGLLGNMFGGGGNFGFNANANEGNAATFIESEEVPPVPQDLNALNPTFIGMVSRNQPMGLMSQNKISNI